MPPAPGPLRIGQFARRVGVSSELLRAWERRYGLLEPVRSPGGFRLYTDEDAGRVARMQAAITSGLSASEAARVAMASRSPSVQDLDSPRADLLEDAAARLLAAIKDYNEPAVHLVLDQSLTAFGLETTVRDVIVPILTEIGSAWIQDDQGISQEHFASNLIRGRLLSLMRLGTGDGPLAILACLPGEEHDLSLLAFGLLLRLHGWRIVFLGANTPVSTLTQTARATDPAVVVVSSFDPGLFEASGGELQALGELVPLAIGGPGASEETAASVAARWLEGNLIDAARQVSLEGLRAR